MLWSDGQSNIQVGHLQSNTRHVPAWWSSKTFLSWVHHWVHIRIYMEVCGVVHYTSILWIQCHINTMSCMSKFRASVLHAMDISALIICTGQVQKNNNNIIILVLITYINKDWGDCSWDEAKLTPSKCGLCPDHNHHWLFIKLENNVQISTHPSVTFK